MPPFENLKDSICDYLRAVGEPSQRRLSILVVEDSVAHFTLLKQSLEHEFPGLYKVDHSIDVPTALRLLPHNRYDAYIVDWFLSPEKNGDAFIKTAHRMGYDGPFIVWSGTHFTERELKNLCSGIPVGYIEKAHTSVEMMNRIIREAVAQYRTNRLSGIVVPFDGGTKILRRECYA